MEPILMFEQLLMRHDWNYMMSDDSRVYARGAKEALEIRQSYRKLSEIGLQAPADALMKQYRGK